MGTLARALEDFFTARRLALPTDQAEQLAAGRRQRRVDDVPEPLRSAVAGFAGAMLRALERARRAGTRPRSDHTIETALATMRDLARFLISDRNKREWALVDVHDIEAFLVHPPKSRKRRLVGILALLHGASSHEARLLQVDDINHQTQSIWLGNRPHPAPLDPASWAVLQRCLAHRDQQRTINPHVLVTKGTKAGQGPASTAYLSHVLDSCGVSPRIIRSTRLVELVNTMDPKLVAAAFGMDAQSPLVHLADHVDPDRLPPAISGDGPRP